MIRKHLVMVCVRSWASISSSDVSGFSHLITTASCGRRHGGGGILTILVVNVIRYLFVPHIS